MTRTGVGIVRTNCSCNTGARTSITRACGMRSGAGGPNGCVSVVNGGTATCNFVTTTRGTNHQLFLNSCPVAPTASILRRLSGRGDLNIAAIRYRSRVTNYTSSIKTTFTNTLTIASASNPKIYLGSRTVGLTIVARLPLIVLGIRHNNPSAKLPAGDRRASLLRTLFKHGKRSPVPIVTTASPAGYFSSTCCTSGVTLRRVAPIILLASTFITGNSKTFGLPSLGRCPSVGPPCMAPSVTRGCSPCAHGPRANTHC